MTDSEPKVIDRSVILEGDDTLLQEVLKREPHHDHEIIEVSPGHYRWKEDPSIKALADSVSLNELVPAITAAGHDKNSEVYRKFYRDIGYSLSGYWEIFFWDVNNPAASTYRSPKYETMEGVVVDKNALLEPGDKVYHENRERRNSGIYTVGEWDDVHGYKLFDGKRQMYGFDSTRMNTFKLKDQS